MHPGLMINMTQGPKTHVTGAEKNEIEIVTSGCLFDLDGTLIESTESVVAFWRDFSAKHGIDADELLQTSHGRRTIDNLQIWRPELATAEHVKELEASIISRWKQLAHPVPGAVELLAKLPADRWGIVTSGTDVLARGWLTQLLKIAIPDVFITGECITQGKPHPEGYLAGHKALNLLQHFLVFEDAPAGIKAGKDAGAVVIGMATTYNAQQVKQAGADIVIADMTHVHVKSWDASTGALTLVISDPA